MVTDLGVPQHLNSCLGLEWPWTHSWGDDHCPESEPSLLCSALGWAQQTVLVRSYPAAIGQVSLYLDVGSQYALTLNMLSFSVIEAKIFVSVNMFYWFRRPDK